MGTRSTIALEFADGTIKQVYCHWDGYLEHNGTILEESYMDPFKVKTLVEMGSLSSLGAEIGTKVHFDDRVEGQCKFYTRDRGEKLSVNTYKDLGEYYRECLEEEYDYILRNIKGTATWFVRCNATEGSWVTLKEAARMKDEYSFYNA